MAGRRDRGVTPGADWRARVDAFCERRGPHLLAVMIGLWTAIFSWHVHLKYRYYLYTDIDCALFVQIVDGILRGSLFSSIRGMNWLGDHSSLILFLVAPVYAVFRHPVTLPILQCVALALGALPVWALARRELGRGLVPLGFALVYLLFPAVGYTALYEFHPEVLCTTTLLAAIACHRADRFGWTLLFAAVSLLGKEDVALPVGAMALLALLDHRPRRGAYAAGLGAMALVSLLLSFAVLKPALSAGEVDYGRLYLLWGDSPGEVARNILRQPLKAVSALLVSPDYPLDTVVKHQYYLHMLLPLLLLPLASPRTLAIALPTLGTHFLSWRPAQHTIYYQYTALITPFVIAAAVIGLRNLLSLGARADAPARGGGPPGARRAALAVMLALVAASLASNWMFGPLTAHGHLQMVAAEEAVAPTGKDRALTRHRDRMMATLGNRDSAVAGFEFLSRLASRPHVRSFHNIAGGLHTFSTKPYPVPDDVTGLIVDVAHARIRPYAKPGTGARVREMLRRNRLGLVEAAGDILLFLRDAPDSVEIWREGEASIARPTRVVFDGQLAYLGNELLATTVTPGGLLPLRTHWRKVAPTDSLYVLELAAYDGSIRMAFATMRYLGYMLHPAGDWPDTTMVSETYRLVIPDDTAPGTYMLGMRVGRRAGLGQTRSDTDDPRVRAQNMVVELGTFTILPPER
jgi:uncharacterized membrane protein